MLCTVQIDVFTCFYLVDVGVLYSTEIQPTADNMMEHPRDEFVSPTGPTLTNLDIATSQDHWSTTGQCLVIYVYLRRGR